MLTPGVLLLIFFILTFLRVVMGHLKMRAQLQGIPGPSGYPIFGNSLEIISDGNKGNL